MRDFIIENPGLFTQESLKECLDAGFITQTDYNEITGANNNPGGQPANQ